ncbi:DUF2625 family protein [Mycobacteroides abscessus]|uniref:DUF2625 family protein n=1 Tax=Mycobacteroides abscessus TaxID=36809 RepID=UPI000C25A3AE|nr:DUF2625 family protein [Mycobacteroides abscessus]
MTDGSMHLRTVDELTDVDEPAWPQIQEWVNGGAHRLLPISNERARAELERLQVTVRSGAGALTYHCGGILADHGWLKIFGGGTENFPSLHNMTGEGLMVCAVDVLGGVFAADWGGIKESNGEIHYWPFDTLKWEPCGFGHYDFLHWALTCTDKLNGFYHDWRWPNWEADIENLTPDVGIGLSPPPSTREGHDINQVSRRPIPMVEICRELQMLGELYADVDPYPIDWNPTPTNT